MDPETSIETFFSTWKMETLEHEMQGYTFSHPVIGFQNRLIDSQRSLLDQPKKGDLEFQIASTNMHKISKNTIAKAFLIVMITQDISTRNTLYTAEPLQHS